MLTITLYPVRDGADKLYHFAYASTLHSSARPPKR
jgi:hypothetical protein